MHLKSLGLDTNYGEVTSNAAENQNHSLRVFRSLSIAAGIIHFMEKTKTLFAVRRKDALLESNETRTVTAEITKKVYSQAIELRKLRWTLSNLVKDSSGFSVQLSVFDGKFKRNIKLNASADSSFTFKERMECSCRYTEMHGYPCFHVAFALVFLPINSYPPSVWSYASKKWYSPVYYIENYIAQYATDIDVPCQATGLIL